MDHFTPLGSWSSEKMQTSRKANPFMMTWVAGKARDAVPIMTHGKGVYLYDDGGQEYLDWTSQAVCANLGHDIPPAVIQAGALRFLSFYGIRNSMLLIPGRPLT
jgi:4-aminobutyrate aminotransferase-like enzyme